MNVLVNTSTRFWLTPDGQLWAPSESFAYSYWTRYLNVFDRVTILARGIKVNCPPDGSMPASGSSVEGVAIPNYSGVQEFLTSYLSTRQIVRTCVCRANAVILQVPCVIGNLVWRSLKPGRPFGAVVCGDPYEVLAPGTLSHPLRPILRWWLSRQLRLQCKGACACSYVTRRSLQLRYPPSKEAFSTHFSSIHLTPDGCVDTPRTSIRSSRPFHLITVGTFETWYKGPDLLLEAFRACVERGLDLTLTFVGDGRYRCDVERMCQAIGLGTRVKFTGQLTFSEAVRRELDKSDLFVLPSRVEGLPKALIEAMARALPCIGTTVGGIPELLVNEDLVPPNDPIELGHRIEHVLRNPERMLRMSARNLAQAQEYRLEHLQRRRTGFYMRLRNETMQWIKMDAGAPRLKTTCSSM